MVSPTRPQTGLDLVYFGLFDNCNARCNMCDCWLLPRSTLGVEHYREVLDKVLELAPKSLRFTGGEPLLLHGLSELVRRATDAGTRVSVISNGRVLASKVAELAGAGCQEVVLSIDAVGARHDTIRDTPQLFDRCVSAMRRMHEVGLPFGVNSVLQRIGIDDLEELGDVLLSQPRLPDWWHLIPIRGEAEQLPTPEQVRRATAVIGRLRVRCADAGVQLIAREEGFAEDDSPHPCSVPTFTAYVRADTGDVFGCNMLVYADAPIGNLLTWRPRDAWNSLNALSLRARCASGTNSACGRCDVSSRVMNHFLRERATAVEVS
ncbi:radical SAM/SPASM domain-containing protein [Lentzea chajnantorensis]